MQLNINDDRKIDDPTAEQIRELLPAVDVEEFCILSHADEQYIQFYRHDDCYALEYREGSSDDHYENESENLSIDAIVAAFVGYLEADPSRWKSNHQWSTIEFDEDFDDDFEEDSEEDD